MFEFEIAKLFTLQDNGGKLFVAQVYACMRVRGGEAVVVLLKCLE